MIVATVFSVFPKPAYAIFGVGDTTITIGDIPGMIWRAIDKSLKTVYSTTFRNQLSTFMNNLAYNTAVQLATGKPGQKPLRQVWDTEKLLNDFAEQAVGEFTQELTKITSGGGVCQITGEAGLRNTFLKVTKVTKDDREEVKGGCTTDAQCPLIAEVADGLAEACKKSNNTLSAGDISVSCKTSLGGIFQDKYFAFKDENDYKAWEDYVKPETLRRDKCVPKGDAQKFEGISLCAIQSPLIDITIRQTASNITRFGQPQKPKCGFNALKRRYDNFKKLGIDGLYRFRNIFNQGESDVSIVFNIGSAGLKKKLDKKQAKLVDIAKNKGFQSKKGTVNEDKVETPASFVEKATEESFFSTPFRQYITQTGDIVADAMNTFTNTFAQKMIQRVFRGLDSGTGEVANKKIDNNFFNKISGITAAKMRYADLLKVSDFKSSEKNSDTILQQLVAGCDINQTVGSGVNPNDLIGVFNCVIDDKFREAVSKRLTIKQALDEGLIDGNRVFGVRGDGSGYEALAKESDIYSLRTILILRKYRILPVGWELAAKYIKDVVQKDGRATKKQYTLKEIINGYYSPQSPFYKLVDPDFQLKIPVAVKETFMPSDRIITEIYIRDTTNDIGQLSNQDELTRVVQRASDSVDTKGCIYENEDGSCRFYGYCTSEKPLWNVDGEKCDSQYNGCQTYTNSLTNSSVSYLQNSVNISVCNEANIGCRAFSDTKDADGNWIGDNQYLKFLDSTTEDCNYENAGCNEYIRLADYANNTLPTSDMQAIIDRLEADNKDIDSYFGEATFVDRVYLGGNRLACTESEVNCRLYEPLSDKTIPNIPGIITPAFRDENGVITYNDECPVECVGYSRYTEAEYVPFGYPEVLNVDFIADTAESCPASYEGCTEFTVVTSDRGEEVVYYSDFRQCELTSTTKPNKTFFTWEGDEESGYQLRTWRLVESSDGGPEQNGGIDTVACNESVYNLPEDNPDYNPDCREYTDENLVKYYRLHSRVIFVTDECQSIRRTADGTIFNILPSESQSCPAKYDGCRRYKPSNTGSGDVVFNSTFERGSDGWSGAEETNVSIVTESVSIGGHSLAVDLTQSSGDIYRSVEIKEGKRYILEFWAKSESGSISLSASIQGENGNTNFEGVANLTNSWDMYKLNTEISFVPSIADRVAIVPSGVGVYYIDNIKLYEIDDLYLIKDSWDTPASCVAPESQLGCQEYKNDKGDLVYIKNFSGICEEKYVGCEALIDTKNSEVVGGYDYAGVFVPKDEIVYYVNDPDYYCPNQGQYVGCTELGIRSKDADGNDVYNTVYKVLDPDLYEENICEPTAEYCGEYIPEGSGSGFPQYFKDPLNKVCEYRTGVIIDNEDGTYTDPKNGWFKTNITGEVTRDDICELDDGSIINVVRCGENAPVDDCWTYTCPASQSSCSEYQDPVTPRGCDKDALPGEENACNFYYLLKDSLSSGIQECNGIVSPSGGCIGLFDVSKGEESKYLRADCQEQCPLIKYCYDTSTNQYDKNAQCQSNNDCGTSQECRAVPVRELPSCQPDFDGLYPTSKPGCVI